MVTGNRIWLLIVTAAVAAAALAVASGKRGPAHADARNPYLTKAIKAAYPGFVGQDVELARRSTELASEYKAGDDRARRESDARGAKVLAQNELTKEEEWNRVGTTPCKMFGQGAAAQLCIERLGPETRSINTPVAYRVRWRNLPARAFIRVWSRNAAPAGERWKYMGAYGAVAPAALAGSRDGDQQITWDGRSIYCAPADAPMMCDAGEVGQYVLRAAIMTGSDPFWPSWPIPDPVPVVRIAQSETRPFTLDGPPQPVAAAGRYRSYPFRREIVDAVKKALPDGTNADWYVERRIDRLGPWRAGPLRYCASLTLDAPLTGSIDVCFSRFRRNTHGIALSRGDLTASGDARLAQGLLSSKDAVARATAYAIGMTGKQATYPAYPGETDMVRTLFRDPKTYDGSYQTLRNSARDAGLTYVEVNQPWPSFRDDSKRSWWLVQLGLWIQTIDGPRVKDWGKMSLRVDQNGKVCQIRPTGKSEGMGADRRDTYSGCLSGSQRSEPAND